MAHAIPTPRDPAYWSRDALVAEERRVFEICNGCRLCFNLCPSFPELFNAVDALEAAISGARLPSALVGGAGTAGPAAHPEDSSVRVDALGKHAAPSVDAGGEDDASVAGHAAPTRDDVLDQAAALQQLPLKVHDRVVELCWQCKKCDPICPYTPPHEFAVDFPRLMLRHKAIDARENGVSLQDRVLGDPDLLGRAGTLLPALANAGAGLRANRVAMEWVAGIHRDRQLPKFATQTFLSWFRARHPEGSQPSPASVEGPKVVLFYTCSVQWNEPQVGRAAVEVLEHNGFTVYCPEFRCCGMPALDGGDVARATAWAAHDVEILLPYVLAGCDVVSPGPTCSYMMKKEWPDYLGRSDVGPGPDCDRRPIPSPAEQVSLRTFDLMEYLFNLRKSGRMREDYEGGVGRVGYHLPCHLKIQKIGYRSRDVLKGLPGAQVTMVDKCSCMDGTWGMKREFYGLSKQCAEPLLSDLAAAEAPILASDCLIAKLQIEEGTKQKVVHPIEVVWKAYGGTADRPLAALPPLVSGADKA